MLRTANIKLTIGKNKKDQNMKLKNAQAGFSALDAILVVVLLAALGAAAYFAYQNMHNNGQGSSTASVSPLPHVKASPTPTAEKGGVLTITQFGVKLTVPSGLTGLAYIYVAPSISKDATGKQFNNPARVDLISSQLKGQKSNCSGPFDGNIGSISRDTAAPTNMDGSPLQLPNPGVKKIDTYYYQLGLPNGDCFFGTSLAQTESNQRTLIQQAFATLAQ